MDPKPPIKLSIAQLTVAAHMLSQLMRTAPYSAHLEGMRVFAVPRGGVPAAFLIERLLGVRFQYMEDPGEAQLFIDDLVDSGATLASLRARYPNTPAVTLITKNPEASRALNALWGVTRDPNQWLVFPWEDNPNERSFESSAEDIARRLLQFVGEDTKREGLLETPARFVRAWREWSEGYALSAEEVLKGFEDGAQNYDEMVAQCNIPVYSHCEHHLAPFFGQAHVAYVPDGKIVGLSKLSRLVDVFAHRLQVQERLTKQIADALETHLGARGVAVVLECRHLCMESRGIRRAGTSTVTSALRGLLKESDRARAEFYSLIHRSRLNEHR